jgi:protein tyrosine/serine phosphatase
MNQNKSATLTGEIIIMKKRIIIFSVLCLIAFGSYWLYTNVLMHQSQPADTVNLSRPAQWAVPLDKPGLRNLYKVSDQLYRGAQPETNGLRHLEELGIKTVVSLELFHSDRSKIEESGSRLNYEHIYMQTWRPTDNDVIRFMKIVSDTSRTPVFVHCYHGSDRTGTMCAIYRIVMQNWTKDEAIREMKEGGYGFHAIWTNLIEYINRLDADQIRKDLALKK